MYDTHGELIITYAAVEGTEPTQTATKSPEETAANIGGFAFAVIEGGGYVIYELGVIAKVEAQSVSTWDHTHQAHGESKLNTILHDSHLGLEAGLLSGAALTGAALFAGFTALSRRTKDRYHKYRLGRDVKKDVAKLPVYLHAPEDEQG